MNKRLIFVGCSLISMQALAGGLKLGNDKGAGAALYGFARLDTIYSDTRLNHPQFPSYVPVATSKEKELEMHGRLSRLGLKFWSGKLAEGKSVEGKLEIDFQNGGSESRAALRMRHAYGILHIHNFSLLAGQTWHLVSQLYPSANSDSLMWNAGNTGDRAAQLRAGYKLNVGSNGAVNIQAAAVMPNVVDKKDHTDDDGRVIMNDGMPGIQARLAFDMPLWTKQPLHVAASTAYATEKHGDSKKTTLGYFAELVIPLMDNLGIRGEWFMGKNLSDLRGGINQGLNEAGDEINTMGFWSELYYSPIKTLKISAGYTQDHPDEGDLDDGARLKNSAIYGVVGYRPWSDFRVQAEYIRWTTAFKAADEMTANRVNIHFSYFF